MNKKRVNCSSIPLWGKDNYTRWSSLKSLGTLSQCFLTFDQHDGSTTPSLGFSFLTRSKLRGKPTDIYYYKSIHLGDTVFYLLLFFFWGGGGGGGGLGVESMIICSQKIGSIHTR
jgi:hypothetical protein